MVFIESIGAIRGRNDFATLLQGLTNELENRRVVIDDEDFDS